MRKIYVKQKNIMYFKKIILSIYTLLAINSCGQNSKNNINIQQRTESDLKSYKKDIMYNKYRNSKQDLYIHYK